MLFRSVTECIRVENAYALFMEYVKQGKMKVGRFEDKSEKQLEWWYSCCIEYLKEKHMMETPDCSYASFIKSKLPGGVGKIYCRMQFAEGIIHGNKRFDIKKLAG